LLTERKGWIFWWCEVNKFR